ncbi:transposase family protein [Nocardia terpenica]|uniref:DDE Tnp4 domain-containing protein n=1 Tax=Nocardia terpenica TaxID=455432 RepID=A0A6G9YZT6_9NOCA|nr:hypothetical protein F6W96_08595 [Nocardia terpenica]
MKGKTIDLWYSGKAGEHGGLIQALCAPDGFPLWVSDVEPGSVHDITAAREHVPGVLYWAAAHLDLPTLADPGYDGADSPSSPAAGVPRATSPPAPKESAPSSKPHSPSPITNTTGPHEILLRPPQWSR